MATPTKAKQPVTPVATGPAFTPNPTAPKLDQNQLDYFNKQYGGIDNYKNTQQLKYDNGDQEMRNKVLADAMRVGYSITGGPPKQDLSKALTYDSALNQANQQLDPGYQRAVQNVQAQQYQNQLNGGELASAHGGAHSGLAADLQNKVNIAAQGQIGDLDAQRASQAAEMAQALLQRDQDVNFRNRQQDFTEWQGKEGLNLSRDQYNRGIYESDRTYNRNNFVDDRNFNYQQGRDKVADNQWQTTFDYGKTRDNVADSQWNKTFDYNAGRDKVADSQWAAEFGLSKQKAAASASGGSGGKKSSTSGISDVNQPWTVSDMKTYINKNLPGSKTGPMGPPSPNQQATIENLILSNPNLSDKSVIQLYQYYGIPVPQ